MSYKWYKKTLFGAIAACVLLFVILVLTGCVRSQMSNDDKERRNEIAQQFASVSDAELVSCIHPKRNYEPSTCVAENALCKYLLHCFDNNCKEVQSRCTFSAEMGPQE